jgi:Domain of unknown function (DUF1918)
MRKVSAIGARLGPAGNRRRDVRVRKGDRIIVESERAAQPGRVGLIEKVLEQEPPRYQVRWEDGRTSIFSPSAGAATIEPKSERVKAQ